MNTSRKTNKRSSDPIDRLVHEQGLRIQDVHVHKELDVLLLLLSNGSVIKVRISDYPRLKRASPDKLNRWDLISKGIGVHWEELDEDISLSGLIRNMALEEATLRLNPQSGIV